MKKDNIEMSTMRIYLPVEREIMTDREPDKQEWEERRLGKSSVLKLG